MIQVRKNHAVRFFIAGISAVVFFLGFSLFRAPARAVGTASLYVSPSAGTFTVGSTFTVSLYVNTGGQFVNAVSANLSFPANELQVVSPSAGSSFIQVWIDQPAYSNSQGTLHFQGAVPTPGISTSAGLISTVTFRVTSIGSGIIKILDTSHVLLNDGHGTDILGQTSNGIYNFALPPPAGPVVTSQTNPDQTRWYNVPSTVFSWTPQSSDVEGYSYELDDDPAGNPDDISEGLKTRISYANLSDGIHYFHIKSLRGGAWGGVTDYAVHIDATPPAAFPVQLSPGAVTSNQRPIIYFFTTDNLSGVDHYELKIISLDPLGPAASIANGADTPFFTEEISPYLPELAYGNYDVLVRAYDQAGNYTQSEEKLSINPPFLGIFMVNGIRINDQYTITWPYLFGAIVLLLVLIIVLAFLARIEHHEVEKLLLKKGAGADAGVARKLAELKAKQEEYQKNKIVLLLLFFCGAGLLLHASGIARADNTVQQPPTGSLEPPVVTIFPTSLSNEEVPYIGGQTDAQNAQVLIYLQNTDTGSTFGATATTTADGEWFYSFPKFFSSGNYIVWTQMKLGGELSPPSSRLSFIVAPTAIQIGENRFSYGMLYLWLFIFAMIAFCVLLIFTLHHYRHIRVKRRQLEEMIRSAHESVNRGFAELRRDIEMELMTIKRAKFSRELSEEEKQREEKLLKDFDDINRSLGEEIWRIEKTEEGG